MLIYWNYYELYLLSIANGVLNVLRVSTIKLFNMGNNTWFFLILFPILYDSSSLKILNDCLNNNWLVTDVLFQFRNLTIVLENLGGVTTDRW